MRDELFGGEGVEAGGAFHGGSSGVEDEDEDEDEEDWGGEGLWEGG